MNGWDLFLLLFLDLIPLCYGPFYFFFLGIYIFVIHLGIIMGPQYLSLFFFLDESYKIILNIKWNFSYINNYNYTVGPTSWLYWIAEWNSIGAKHRRIRSIHRKNPESSKRFEFIENKIRIMKYLLHNIDWFGKFFCESRLVGGYIINFYSITK